MANAGGGLDFATVGAQLQYWLTHISQFWKGPWNGSGENGIDIGIPYHTPIYALQSGPVVGAGYYGGGGVVSVQTAPGISFYYQHLSDLVVQVGQNVQAGTLIGYSGGQLGYGDHPSSPQYSSGPHIEIGINPPYGATGIWHSEGANVNPLPMLQGLLGSLGGTATGAPTGAAQASGYALDACAQQFNCSQYWPIDPRYAYCIGQVSSCRAKASITNTATQQATDWTNGVLGGLTADITQATGTNSLQDLGYRTLFVVAGLTLALIGLTAFLFSGGKQAEKETINLVEPGGMSNGSSGGANASTSGAGAAGDSGVAAGGADAAVVA
ncbi:MAG TPA: M23 family metallopeptidase [Ktedonobacterales bacterium]|nr:M23 family metallopeptidase [Ktedonobacterales bacterium]